MKSLLGTSATSSRRLNRTAAASLVIALLIGTLVIPGIAAAQTSTPMAGHNMQGDPTATTMPGMPEPATGVTTMPQAGSDPAAALAEMQQMMQSLQGLVEQLQQKAVAAAPAATPTPATMSADMQAIMAEMQDLKAMMGPLMVRIQADVQGNPSADELAAVRTQVQQLDERVLNLMRRMQAARSGGQMSGMQGMTSPTVTPVPAQNVAPAAGNTQVAPTAENQAALDRVQRMLDQIQAMVLQLRAGNAPAVPAQQGAQPGAQQGAQPGGMSGMNMATPVPGASGMAQPTPMPGMSGSSGTAAAMPMDKMMMMMDNMMMMMSNMMSMMDNMMPMMDMDMMGMGGMGSMGGMATPTPDPSMGGMGDM